MSLSGSFQSYPVSSFGLYCEWSAAQSIPGNYSDVTLRVYLSYYSLEVVQRSGSVSINGTAENFTSAAISDYSSGWKKALLKTKTVRVNHSSGGTANNIALSASWQFNGSYSGQYIGTITAETTINLNAIDRSAPTVTISLSNIQTASVALSASSSVTCDIWQYSRDNGATWTQFSTASGVSASTTITGLSPNTQYTIKVRARKKSNQVYGSSAGSSITTIGNAVLNGVNTVTADNATVAITFNRTIHSSSYTYTLDLKNGSTTILTFTLGAQSTGTADQTITLTSSQRTSLLAAMANVKAFPALFVLTTKNGSSVVGNTSTMTAQVRTTSTNSAPIFSNAAGFTYRDSNNTTSAVTENNQLFIQDYSTLEVSAYAATPRNGASIAKYEVSIDERTVSSASTTLNLGRVKTAGELTLTLKAIDSRGYSTSKSQTITVLPYEPIDIRETETSIRRVNEVEALTEVSFAASISKLLISGVNKNSLQLLKYASRKTSQAGYNADIVITSQASSTDTKITFSSDEFVSLDPDYSYNIKFTVSDRITSDSFVLTLPSGTPLISKRKKKVGINNRNPTRALDVIGNIGMNGYNVHGFISAVDSSTDLNDVCEPGIYEISPSSSSLHYPSPSSICILEVIQVSRIFWMQRVTNVDGRVYLRTYYNGTWHSWS